MVIPNETEREHPNKYLRLVLMVTASYKAREKGQASCNSPASDFGEDEQVFSRHMKLDTTANNFEGKKKISVNLSHQIQSYFLKPKLKQTSKYKA